MTDAATPTAMPAVTGLVLAGGGGVRMGGVDKGLIPWRGATLIETVLAGLRPQVEQILISANRHHDRYARFGHPVIADTVTGCQGPLAGMLAGMARATTPLLLVVPCDCPAVPPDLAQRLAAALHAERADLAVAHDGQRLQLLHVLLHTRLLDALRRYLESGERRVGGWYQSLRMATVDCSDAADLFLNLNTPQDLAAASSGGDKPPTAVN